MHSRMAVYGCESANRVLAYFTAKEKLICVENRFIVSSRLPKSKF